MRTYICVYFGSAYLALIITPLVIWLARRIGVVGYPDMRYVHTRPIPRIGGIAIYVPFMCLIVSLLFLDNAVGQQFRQVRLQIITLLCAAGGVFLVGLIGDLRRLPARFKFFAELLGASVLCLAGVRIDSIGLSDSAMLSLGWLGVPITLLWIVGVTNAVNMSDGLDGLAAGVAAIACGVIAVFAIYGSTIHTGLAASNDIMMALFALALLGGLSGFLFFNFNPAKVFMGDCGSLFIGFTIAAASIMCVSKSAALVGLALPALALGIPIFDTLFSMLRRFLEGRSLFAPDRSHFHHRLLELGLNQGRAVLIIYVATLLAAGIGLCMLVGNSVSVLIVFGGVLLMVLLLFRAVGVVRLHELLQDLGQKFWLSERHTGDDVVPEDLKRKIHEAVTFEEWWSAVCQTAERLHFERVQFTFPYADKTHMNVIWIHPEARTIFGGVSISITTLVLQNRDYVRVDIPTLANFRLFGARYNPFEVFRDVIDRQVPLGAWAREARLRVAAMPTERAQGERVGVGGRAMAYKTNTGMTLLDEALSESRCSFPETSQLNDDRSLMEAQGVDEDAILDTLYSHISQLNAELTEFQKRTVARLDAIRAMERQNG